MKDLAERIARLVAVPVRLPADYRRFEEIRQAVAGDGVGGILLFGGDLDLTPRFLRRLREAAEHPLLVMSDVERGVGQQIEGCLRHPPPMAVGALRDASAAYALGAATALECRRAGIDVALAPVLDLYNEPRNPIVGPRSFGEDPELASLLGVAWIEGCQEEGVLACAKHFPGHGDTAEDSHHELPVVATLEEAALLPFRAAVEAGVRCVMTAHIVVRSLGDEPATMSPRLLRELLRDELGFDGLVMTDALEMRAISATVGVEEGAVRALAAGADAIGLGHDLFDEATGSVIAAIADAVRAGRLAESRLVEAAGRVREASHPSRAAAPEESVDSSIGREAARRAVVVEGTADLAAGPLVVELAPEPGMAAGALPEGPGDWFAEVVPGTDVVRVHDGDVGDALLATDGRQVVVIARDAYRHAWQRDALVALLAAAEKAVVVEVGLPHWRPEAATSYVATYGAGRVNVQAAAERLYSGVATRGGAVR